MCAFRVVKRNFFNTAGVLLPLILFILNVLPTRTCNHSAAGHRPGSDAANLEQRLKHNSSWHVVNSTNANSVSEEEVRLEYIKRQILHKLGMNRVPKVKRKTLDTSIYQPILEQQLSTQPFTTSPSFSEESDKLFLFPSSVMSTSATFNITLNAKASKYAIKKISLFVKIRRSEDNDQPEDVTLVTLSPSNGNRSVEKVLAVVQPVADSSDQLLNDENQLQSSLKWNEYNLTQILSTCITPYDSHNQLLLVDSENHKIFSSFITVEYDFIAPQRNKRSIDCNPNGNSSSCCRESFYVNFTHIHWDDWILQPQGYFANYCKGKCDISHARYHHTTVVQKYQSVISLCCSPREMSSIPLIYIDENGYVLKKILMNMVVESCDCA